MRFLRSLACAGLGLALITAVAPSLVAAPKLEEWADTQGAKFRGTPSALIGPFALFRTGATTARRLPVNFLRAEDRVRFQDAIATLPARAADWSKAKSAISVDLIGRVQRVKDGKLVPADLAGKPEPEVYILFFVNHGVGPSWEMMGSAMEKYGELTARFPGQVEAVMVGSNHPRGDQADMATGMKIPWLVTDVLDQGAMHDVNRFAPGEAPAMAIVTRGGTALFTSTGDKKEKVVGLLTQLQDLLDLAQRTNPQSWPPLDEYWRVVQLAHFHTGTADPVLVGDPLRAAVLREHGAESFTAELAVDSYGKVVNVTIEPGAKLPETLVNPVRLALAQAALVPAVADGKFVAGKYTYRFPPAN